MIGFKSLLRIGEGTLEEVDSSLAAGVFGEGMSKESDLRKSEEKWEEEILKDRSGYRKERKGAFLTESGVPIKRLYTPTDLADINFDYLKDLGFPGQYPFTRGRSHLAIEPIIGFFSSMQGSEIRRKRTRDIGS